MCAVSVGVCMTCGAEYAKLGDFSINCPVCPGTLDSPFQCLVDFVLWGMCPDADAWSNTGRPRLRAGAQQLPNEMSSVKKIIAFSVAALLCAAIAPASAAPVTINGATFDAPGVCQSADRALVCKVDGQQLELWVTRKPLAPEVTPTDSLARRMAYFSSVHETAVGNIQKATGNTTSTPFSSYGSFSADGSAMPGKGVVTSPSMRFASVLHGEEIWEFLEIVATRTPAIDAVSALLQHSLMMPAVAVVGNPVFTRSQLSMQYPDFLAPVVIEDTATSLVVNFKHKTRPAGPSLIVSLRTVSDKQATAAAVVQARKEAAAAGLVGPSAMVDVNKLGDLSGVGFALIGVPKRAGGAASSETIETTFASVVNNRILEVRLTVDQKFSAEAEAVWALLEKTLSMANKSALP